LLPESGWHTGERFSSPLDGTGLTQVSSGRRKRRRDERPTPPLKPKHVRPIRGDGVRDLYLIIDCETTGRPRDWNARLDYFPNWPRAVQVAWELYDEGQQRISHAAHIVRPIGYSIPRDAAAIHGITTERALSEGVEIESVLNELATDARKASVFVAHNARFDGSILAVEYLRLGVEPPFRPHEMTCTMTESTDYCRLPGPYGNKWPRLEELYELLFGERLDGAHDASVDASACARCYFELGSRGVISTEPRRV